MDKIREYTVLARYKANVSGVELVSNHGTPDAAERSIMKIKLGKTDYMEDGPIFMAKLKRYQ